ncbi:MAG: tRNA 2-thiouridine(34) synthase MnmA [Endomicrobiaceae bacterium]|nr:tRNA 2-thiouridine(34) synthase MnmA [Endomicrobiaceae bacterium]
MNKKAIVAMSGGVDSSVAAYLIKQEGFETVGVTLKLVNNEDVGVPKEKSCCSLKDIADARDVSFKIGIKYYVFNFTENFKDNVINRFIQSYENGLTPNPCIDCNRYIKFEKLLERAINLDFDYVVTGHYAIIEKDKISSRFILKKSLDNTKDQSYVLYSLTQNQLSKILLPIGKMKKSEIRDIALEQGFTNAKKHDSQDICFVPNGNYVNFIENYTGKKYNAGNFVDNSGKIIGQHNGIINYTIGQRRGLGLYYHKPLFVCNKDVEKNTITLGSEQQLYSKSLVATDINLIACESIGKPLKVKAKIRYNQKEQSATVEQIDNNKLHIEFDVSQRAITKGQAVVLYDNDIVIGGGTIV